MRYDIYDSESNLLYSTDAYASQIALRAGEQATVHGGAEMLSEHEWQLLKNQILEVPRYCGVLALKRHKLEEGDLLLLGPEDDWEAGSLYADVLAFSAALPAGEARDKLVVALNDVLHWSLLSPTVADLCAVLGLSVAQRDELFEWAKAHEATL